MSRSGEPYTHRELWQIRTLLLDGYRPVEVADIVGRTPGALACLVRKRWACSMMTVYSQGVERRLSVQLARGASLAVAAAAIGLPPNTARPYALRAGWRYGGGLFGGGRWERGEA